MNHIEELREQVGTYSMGGAAHEDVIAEPKSELKSIGDFMRYEFLKCGGARARDHLLARRLRQAHEATQAHGREGRDGMTSWRIMLYAFLTYHSQVFCLWANRNLERAWHEKKRKYAARQV